MDVKSHVYGKGKDAAIGTPASHYSPPSDGPFECGECIHFHKGNSCDHPKVIKDANDGKLELGAKGWAIVEAHGCCEYQRSK